MSTAIEWTDETWNPVTGCTKVSPGCDHCYAERVTERWSGKGSFAEVKLHPERLDKPLRWRKPRKVFVNSMSDLFHEDVPDEFIARAFAVMAQAEQHTFQILTKRHGRMRSLLSSPEFEKAVDREWCSILDWFDGRIYEDAWMGHTWPLPNVWLGVSVEDQKWANIRVPALLDTPAAVRFLSCEPLLGPVDLSNIGPEPGFDALLSHPGIDWVIVGGESGPGARPMQPEWARDIRDWSTVTTTPFLFKQWGGITPKAGGRELDGRTWDEYPADRTAVA